MRNDVPELVTDCLPIRREVNFLLFDKTHDAGDPRCDGIGCAMEDAQSRPRFLQGVDSSQRLKRADCGNVSAGRQNSGNKDTGL
jgi:hypothetical protein